MRIDFGQRWEMRYFIISIFCVCYTHRINPYDMLSSVSSVTVNEMGLSQCFSFLGFITNGNGRVCVGSLIYFFMVKWVAAASGVHLLNNFKCYQTDGYIFCKYVFFYLLIFKNMFLNVYIKWNLFYPLVATCKLSVVNLFKLPSSQLYSYSYIT